MTAWVAWVALITAAVSLGLIVAAVVVLRLLWRRAAPTVAPLLAMFAPQDAAPVNCEHAETFIDDGRERCARCGAPIGL